MVLFQLKYSFHQHAQTPVLLYCRGTQAVSSKALANRKQHPVTRYWKRTMVTNKQGCLAIPMPVYLSPFLFLH